jgi:hypothetical protein
MIHRLYNPWHITNSGEKEADKQLSFTEGLDEDFYVISRLKISSRYHRTQMAGECDFAVITRLGIMVIEVKGGIIGYGKGDNGSHGYYRGGKGSTKESIKEPFTQAEGNADAIRRYLNEKGMKGFFVGSMACFSECEFTHKAAGTAWLWHRGHALKLPAMILASLEEQLDDFHSNEKAKGMARYTDWKELDEVVMKQVSSLLEPEFDPKVYQSKMRLNLAEADRRLNEGLHVLQGLSDNKRLIVEGPPGSGKSTYALDLIARLCKNQGKKGLYLCWNELLAARIQQWVSDAVNEIPAALIRVMPYFELAHELGELSGDKALIPTYDKICRGEMRQQVKGAVNRLGNSKKAVKYDFIIADEAQDLFDKGLDQVIKGLLKVNNPLQNGNYYILYDDSQAYPVANDLRDYVRTRDTLKDSGASYKLFSNLRANTGRGIGELILDAGSGTVDIAKDFGEDVLIRQWKEPGEAIKLLNQYILKEKALSTGSPANMAVLFTADLLKKESPFPALLESENSFEMLNAQNLSLPSQKMRYTSILKAKGLEWDIVFLVCSPLTSEKNIFQAFIGASRAKGRVYLLAKK